MAPAANLKLDLLIKMLGMTQSNNDNQAIVAIRKANDMLGSAGVSWEELLKGKVTVVADPFGGAPTGAPMPQPGNSGWQPRGAANWTPPPRQKPPPPPPPPRSASPPPSRPPSPGPGYIWSSLMGAWEQRPRPGTNYVWSDTLRDWEYVPPATFPQSQTAVINWSRYGSVWILNSNERLNRGDRVEVIRKDGKKDLATVGSFIEDKNGRFYYNTNKTNVVASSSLMP